jgi:serine/threonine protein kinase
VYARLHKELTAMIGQLLTGRYLILKTLGAGGFSETYLARDKYLPHHPLCVVKCLKVSSNSTISLETAQRLFAAEAQILDQLGQEHAQIPKLLAFCREQDQIYQVQEYIDGENLGEWTSQGQALSAEGAIELLTQVLPILDYIHSRQVIHHDIKPSNLQRQRQDGKIVLIDFGAASLASGGNAAGTGSATSEEASLAIGTPGYMPEEQEAGASRFNSDLYALGISVIQLLTGVHPQRLQRDPITGELDWHGFLADRPLEPKLVEILDRMVQVHPRDRYQRAVDALSDLFLLTGVHPPTTGSSAKWWRSMQRRLKPVAAAVVLAGVLGGGYWYRHPEQATAWWEQIQETTRSSEQVLTLLRNVPIQSAIDRMLIAPNNDVLVTAETDHVLHLWSLPGGEMLRALHGHTEVVTVLEMSQDGKLLASGSEDQTVRLWDTETGTLLRTLNRHNQAITTIAISPDQKTIASGDEDGVLHLWDLQTGALLQSFTVTGKLVAVTYGTPDQLISANSDRQIQVWDLRTGSLQRTFVGHTASIVGLRMADDHTLFSFGEDRTLVWDVEQEALVSVLSEDSANPISTLLNDQQMVTVHNNGNVRMWTREVGRLVATVPGKFEQSLNAVLSSDHRYLVSWSPEQRLQVWQMRSKD